MLQGDLPGKEVRKVSIMDGEIEVLYNVMGNDPRRREFVSKTEVIMPVGRRACM